MNSRPVHSMMSSHLFFCLLPPFTVPCNLVLARPDERETCPYHFDLHLFAMVRSLCGLIACWILVQTSTMIMWFLYKMHSILWEHPISMAHILLCSPAVRIHDSQAHRKMDVTREHISHILELREMLLSSQTGFNLVNAVVVCAWNPQSTN